MLVPLSVGGGGEEGWKLLVAQNWFDLKVQEYAESLFHRLKLSGNVYDAYMMLIKVLSTTDPRPQLLLPTAVSEVSAAIPTMARLRITPSLTNSLHHTLSPSNSICFVVRSTTHQFRVLPSKSFILK